VGCDSVGLLRFDGDRDALAELTHSHDDLRGVVNALLYMASSGGAWRLLPKDFPPTVQKSFWGWRDEGLLRAINHELVMAAREREGPGGKSVRRRHLACCLRPFRCFREPIRLSFSIMRLMNSPGKSRS